MSSLFTFTFANPLQNYIAMLNCVDMHTFCHMFGFECNYIVGITMLLMFYGANKWDASLVYCPVWCFMAREITV